MAASFPENNAKMDLPKEVPPQVVPEEYIDAIIAEAPKTKAWAFGTLYKYEGFWHRESFLKSLLILQNHDSTPTNTFILASSPKSGTTWVKSLLYTMINRNRYDLATHPFHKSNPHDCAPIIDHYAVTNPENPIPNTDFSTHIPYSSLPNCIKHSNCPIIYVCRDPRDVFISYWNFTNEVKPKDVEPIPLEEAFDLFCSGIASYGPYWDHVLGYWKASTEEASPKRVFFLKYEDLKRDPAPYVIKLAEFIDHAFSTEEHNEGVVQKIINFCSFDNLSNLQINKVGQLDPEKHMYNLKNKDFFRKGVVGDHKSYLTEDMANRLRDLMKEKLKGTGLELCA